MHSHLVPVISEYYISQFVAERQFLAGMVENGQNVKQLFPFPLHQSKEIGTASVPSLDRLSTLTTHR